ncbi:MAG: hypothetical protein K8S13_13430 [Desulfobacula sp.]|uniref:Rossmann-like domain-containing protein n=1 Tax=Desulfobacula sp. TaxID=2593537 RepID=UPI0025BD40CB|nr:DUF364 domain-containing protein [Desulfobacula sp.]MCD4720841.1 hypothetical protein [Desulfobacula sp.]
MSDSIYDTLKKALEEKIISHDLADQPIDITCKALSALEAIGTPEHDDYPIIKGREVMVEADFLTAKGQSFTDEFENRAYRVKDLLSMELSGDLSTNRKRASFIAGLNAVYRHLGLVDKTIHCKDKEPVLCAEQLSDIIPKDSKVLLVGHQPRFLEKLASYCQVRAVDLDEDNIGKKFFTVTIESAANTQDAINWCDRIFATGSTIVNNTISNFIDAGKPAVFYGVTITAPAKILNLITFCEYGH